MIILNSNGTFLSGCLITDTFTGFNGSPDAIPSLSKNGSGVISSALEINSVSGGVLFPRMTTAQMNLLNVDDALVIYNTTTSQFNFRQGGSWVNLGGGSGYGPGAPTFLQDTFGITNNLGVGSPLKVFGIAQNSVIVGDSALQANTAGTRLTGIGYGVLALNTSGSDNVAAGFSVLGSNTTGSFNTVVGSQSSSVSNADNITSVGYQSLNINSDGSSNSALGYQAGAFIVHGSHNVFFGDLSGGSIASTLNNCSFLGYNASASVSNLTNATAIGANAIVSTNNAIILGDSTAPTNIGIGTSSPTQALHVVGPVQFRDIVESNDYNNPGLIFNQYTSLYSTTVTFAFPMPSPLSFPTQMTVTATINIIHNGSPETAAFAVSTGCILYDGSSYVLVSSGSSFSLTGNLPIASTAQWVAGSGQIELEINANGLAGIFTAVVSSQTYYNQRDF